MQVFHGNIITCDEKNTVAEYLVEKEGRIAFVGDEIPEIYKDCEVVELGDKAMVPAFVDSYMHYSGYSVLSNIFDISDAKSNAEIIERLTEYVETNEDKFVVAFGASIHGVDEGELITKDDLDSISTTRPIVVLKFDAHSAVVNTCMLGIISEKILEANGHNSATGELTQESYSILTDTLAHSYVSHYVIDKMQSTASHMASLGFGTINSASGMGFGRDLDVDLEKWVGKGFDTGMKLNLAIRTLDVDKAVKKGMGRIYPGRIDGTIGSMDAAFIEPYGDTNYYGRVYIDQEKLDEVCKKANRAGLQIVLHAVGDKAFDMATTAISNALLDYPRYDHRHMIVHCCLPTNEGIKKCKQHNIYIVTVPAFISAEMKEGNHFAEIMGDRLERLIPIKTYLEEGLTVCFASDAPATKPNAIDWIYKACNRVAGKEEISVMDALKMCTINGAKLSFEEKEKGSLEIGKSADMVVLSKNPLEIAKEELKTIKVNQLYLNGETYKESIQGTMAQLLRGMFPQ